MGKPVMATKDDGRALHICACPQCCEHPQRDVAPQHTALNPFLALADETTRRLVAAGLARQCGRGGITRLATITGLSRTTIRRGLRERAHPPVLEAGRLRRPGGGRPGLEKKIPASSRRWRNCCARPQQAIRSRD
jgi:hypothetical protein